MSGSHDTPKMRKRVAKSKDVKWLGTLIAIEQSEYWHDPCGKSGVDFDSSLTPLALLAVKRIGRILSIDGKGGL